MPTHSRVRRLSLIASLLAPVLGLTACSGAQSPGSASAGSAAADSSAGADTRPSAAVVTDYIHA